MYWGTDLYNYVYLHHSIFHIISRLFYLYRILDFYLLYWFRQYLISVISFYDRSSFHLWYCNLKCISFHRKKKVWLLREILLRKTFIWGKGSIEGNSSNSQGNYCFIVIRAVGGKFLIAFSPPPFPIPPPSYIMRGVVHTGTGVGSIEGRSNVI